MKLSSKLKKTIDFYDKNADTYAGLIESLVQVEDIYRMGELLGNSGLILDVGCAAGRDSRELKKKGFKIVGIDLSKNLLDIARSKDGASEYLHMDMRELSFEDRKFDGVYASASLLHMVSVKDVRKALGEFHRVLRNGGILHIRVKGRGTSELRIGWVKEKLSLDNKRFFRFFKSQELRKLIEESGFKVLTIKEEVREDIKFDRKLSWISVFAKKVK